MKRIVDGFRHKSINISRILVEKCRLHVLWCHVLDKKRLVLYFSTQPALYSASSLSLFADFAVVCREKESAGRTHASHAFKC